MGKDVYYGIVEVVLKDIVVKGLTRFREDDDPVKRVIFHNADESVLRHMCACADRLVAFDKGYIDMKGVRFERTVQQNYSRKRGDYTVNVGFMMPKPKPEQAESNCQVAA